jgi:antitoxin component of RelBE/YafQ-DinJ toxin-antitoxin module
MKYIAFLYKDNPTDEPNTQTIKAMQDVRDGIGLEEITLEQLKQDIKIANDETNKAISNLEANTKDIITYNSKDKLFKDIF